MSRSPPPPLRARFDSGNSSPRAAAHLLQHLTPCLERIDAVLEQECASAGPGATACLLQLRRAAALTRSALLLAGGGDEAATDSAATDSAPLAAALSSSVRPAAMHALAMAWDILHSGDWWAVPRLARRLYAHAAELTALSTPAASRVEALRAVDVALMLVPPADRAPLLQLVELLAPTAAGAAGRPSGASSSPGGFSWAESGGGGVGAATSPPPSLRSALSISRLDSPPLGVFYSQHMCPATPALLTGAIAHWPALRLWAQPDYLLRVMGERTVPVEMGDHYMASDWGTSLLSMRTFIEQHVVAPALERGAGSRGEGGGAEARDSCVGIGEGQPILGKRRHLTGCPPDDADCPDRSGAGAPTAEGSPPAAAEGAATAASAARPRVAYLAQHALFDQVPQLQGDFSVPDYCALEPPPRDAGGRGEGATAAAIGVHAVASPAIAPLAVPPAATIRVSDAESEEAHNTGAGEARAHSFPPLPPPASSLVADSSASEVGAGGGGDGEDGLEVKAWFGPAGTVSCLHFDEPHNLLAQVVGRKRVRLYPPSATASLYPHPGLMSNTSRVDPADLDAAAFPLFPREPTYDLVLAPGELLYIPPGWWHHVGALDVSFSVSFWWGRPAPAPKH